MRKIFFGLVLLVLVGCIPPQRANDLGQVYSGVNWGYDMGPTVIVKASTKNKNKSAYDSGMISEFKETNVINLEEGKKRALSRCELWKKTQSDAEQINCYVFLAYDPKELQRKTEKVNQDIEKKSREQIMSDIKITCKEFGYKEGTEKFADCLKDLYVKQQSPTIDISSQMLAEELKAQRHQQFYDELLGLGQEFSKGRSFSEIYGGAPQKSGGTVLCNLTNSVQSGTNRICYYKCGVSTQTLNVGAAQQCPLTM
jgi:putative ubiquitin-RnfH superfamily antitoxin RatB of RatAB toxin-antitoxin module